MMALVFLFIITLALGVPVAFSMAVATIGGFIALDIPLETIAQKMLAGIEPFPFVAIPLFILAGGLMETGGISRRLVAFATALVGHIRGGLGVVVVVSELLFSGISGSSVADASAIGSILIPSLVRAGYPPERAAAIVAAAAGMGILIPPCLVMVILGAMSGLSISALFMAGFLPGILMALTLIIVIHIQARRGTLPGARGKFNWAGLRKTIKEAILPLGMPFVLFGGILGGITTATEAAVLAILYALVLDLFVYHELTRKDLQRIIIQTGITTGAVSMLAGIATAMSWVFATLAVPQAIAGFFTQITSSPFLLLSMVMIALIIFSSILDGLPALIIFFPIFSATVAKVGVDPLHFGLLSVAAVGIGLVLPPVGLLLVVVCQIGGVTLSAASRPMIPYISILVVTLLVVAYVPWVVLILPRLLL
ncbi:MAG: TRAP transporter large permease [Betaproteobacteria bacterium]|nr:TRAP transporter large permease [Betaproteobacteria bacterium]